MDKFRAYLNSKCGRHGVTCGLCNDYFGKHRKKLNKLARNKIKKEDKKEFEQFLKEIK